jgi:hypothetical protein
LALWNAVAGQYTLAAPELELLAEACRCADRLERLDRMLCDEAASWVDTEKMRRDDTEFRVTIDSMLSEARQQQTVLKQLVASLRLPDAETGQRPQRRPGAASRVPSGSGSRDRIRAV